MTDPSAARRARAWASLAASGLLAGGWAVALHESDGLSRALPAIAFVALLVASMLALAYAITVLPRSSFLAWVLIAVVTILGYGSITRQPAPEFALECLLIIALAAVLAVRAVLGPRLNSTPQPHRRSHDV